MKRGFNALILKLIALFLSTALPALATLSYFPVFKKGGAATALSGMALLLLLVSITPLIRLFKRFFASPSATGVWCFIFVVFFALSKIAEEMVAISLVGFLGNLAASFIWRISERGPNEE